MKIFQCLRVSTAFTLSVSAFLPLSGQAFAQESLEAATQDIPTPTIIGPLASDSFSRPGNDYTFFTSDIALGSHGYEEEEFFFQGMANAYDISQAEGEGYDELYELPATQVSRLAEVETASVPYTSRMVVRRPQDPEDFNGTVLIEWLNVTDGFDGPYFWVQAKDYLIREGYAYIGVTAQDNSISDPETGLKAFSEARYGALDVAGDGSNCCAESQLSFDIFSQAAKASLEVPAVLNGLEPENLIAAGMSQSGHMLGMYTNYLQMKTPIYDAFLIQVSNPTIRDDLSTPIIKVLSESETDDEGLGLSQSDTQTRKTYWVAGSTHGDSTQRNGRNAMRLRDLGIANTGNDSCGPTGPNGESLTRNRTAFRHVVNAAVYHLKRQIEEGIEPPSGPRFEAAAEDPDSIVARDDMGNAIGGIRLADMAVPTARANGVDCGAIGVWEPFSTEQLQELYPSHEAYVDQVEAAVQASIDAGFVLPEDGIKTIAEARASVIGTGLKCGELCLNRSHYRLDFSSTGILREVTDYYNIKSGESLLEALDAAHRYVAEGDSAEGAAASQYYALAANSLRKYEDLLDEALAQGRVTETAVDVMSMQAEAIIAGLMERL